MTDKYSRLADGVARIVAAIQAIDIDLMGADIDTVQARYEAATKLVGDDTLHQQRFEMLMSAALNVDDMQCADSAVDWESAMRIAAYDLIFTAAFIYRALRKRRGEEIVPARFALVAFDAAERIGTPEWTPPDAGPLEDIFGKPPGWLRKRLVEEHTRAMMTPEPPC